MSMCKCNYCNHIIDSDVDENCFVGDDKEICENCRADMHEAGPELFVALEEAVSHIRSGYSKSGEGLFEFEWSKAIAAITKAKGSVP